jgi:malonyl CoA-acyl carrier protein transacylase
MRYRPLLASAGYAYPQSEQARGHVFLLGHSLGAWFVESYAAFRFEDGRSGFEELAGVIMVDGVRNDPPSEQQYTTDGVKTSVAGPDRDAIQAETALRSRRRHVD